MTPELIATRCLRARRHEGDPFGIQVGIGRPVACSDQEWKCAVIVTGLHDRLLDQHGIDSWQALMLAQRLARQLLEYFLEDGGRLWYPESEDTPVDLSAMFSGGTL